MAAEYPGYVYNPNLGTYFPTDYSQGQTPTANPPLAAGGGMNVFNPNMPLWDIGGYNVPQTPTINPQQAMPYSGWTPSPQVMAGLWEPYQQGANLLTERMAAGGQAGSAMGGFSNAYGDAMGRYYQDASKNIGLQAWQMTQPALMAGMMGNNANNMAQWNAMLGQGRDIWGAQLQEQMYPWQIMGNLMGGGSLQSQPVVNPGDPTGQYAMQALSTIAMLALMA